AVLGEFGSHANGVLDRVRIRRPVSNYADALQAQQGRAAVLRMVKALLEVGECAARKQVPDLPGHRSLQRLFQGGAHQVDHTFGNLQGNVADETIGDDHIDLAVVEVPPLNIPDEIQGKLFQQLEGFAC